MKTLLVVVCLLIAACAPDYSNGSRVGVVTKLSYKGLVCKSWEGEMNMGGMRRETRTNDKGDSYSTMVPNVFAFNVDDSAVAKVKSAQASGATVELVYRQWALKPPCIENSHVIVDVKDPSHTDEQAFYPIPQGRP